MDPLRQPSQSTPPTSFSSLAHELSDSLKSVIRSEARLARAELKENGSFLARHSVRLAIFAIFGLLGLLPLMSFLVIGLGILLNSNFWLSSLIVSLVMFAVGGGLSYSQYKKIKQTDLSFENTRNSVVTQLRTVERKMHEVTDVARSRSRRTMP